jgi:hypothetical protein
MRSRHRLQGRKRAMWDEVVRRQWRRWRRRRRYQRPGSTQPCVNRPHADDLGRTRRRSKPSDRKRHLRSRVRCQMCRRPWKSGQMLPKSAQTEARVAGKQHAMNALSSPRACMHCIRGATAKGAIGRLCDSSIDCNACRNEGLGE